MGKRQQVVQFVEGKTAKIDNAWLRGLIQAIPGVGSTLDTWLFQFSEQKKQQRVQEELQVLAQQLENLEVDVEYVKKHVEEMSYLFERTVVLIAQDYREEMRGAYRTMFAHFTTKGFSELENKELYQQVLAAMTSMHITALRIFADNVNKDGKVVVQPQESKKFVTELLRKFGIEEPLAESLINDLVTRGLVEHMQSSVVGGDYHRYSITSLGAKMLRLINEERVYA